MRASDRTWMRTEVLVAAPTTLAMLLGLLILGASSAHAEGPKPSIDRLAWLAGCWGSSRSGQEISEQWMAPAGGSMLGMSRTVAGGRTVAFEHMRIEEQGGQLTFTSKPSGQSEDSFVASEQADGLIVFENPKHDFPQRIRYQRQQDGSLLARIFGERDGRARAVDFPMTRVPCPQGKP